MQNVMREVSKKVFSFFLVVVLLCTMLSSEMNYKIASATTTEITMPKLQVQGRKLIDSSTGKQVQLRGMSTHGIAWYPEYVNKDAFTWLKENMGISVVRVSMYTSEWGGYCVDTGNKQQLKNLIKNAVQYATDLGLYVIIDWHMLGADEADMEDCNPMHYVEEAKEFFAEMSEYYKDYNNIIYEICNEPNDGEYGDSYNVNWNVIKEYANQVIPVIRENTDNVIIVGTPDWSSDVISAANDLNNANSLSSKYDNIMYTYHFYAASHGSWYRTNVKNALDAGLPIFVTEYGVCEASGDGSIDKSSAKEWFDLFDSYGVSYVKWNMSNKDENDALISSSCGKTSNWNLNELTESGQYIVNEYVTRIKENKYGISAPEPLEAEKETVAEETTTETVKVELEINGCQISTSLGGYRVVYSLSDVASKVKEVGLVYGLADYNDDTDMVVNSTSNTVCSYKATDDGKTDASFSSMADAQSYTMTMKFINSAEFYNADINIRAYAKLKDGSYIYGDVATYSVHGIADYLYRNRKMNNINNHNYLYERILTVVEPAYKMVDYDWDDTVVSLNEL